MIAQPDPDLGIVTMVNAKDHHCRYPYGEPGAENFCYCGRQRDSSPYCPAHHSICLIPVNATKRVSDEDKKMVASLEIKTGLHRAFG